MSLEGKVAVVTGAARGLGRAIALKLAHDGADVSVWDLNLEGAQETARMIREGGRRSIACGGSSANPEDIARAVEKTRAELGPVTILVNNAALSPFVFWDDLTEQIWDDLMAINMKGPFLCCKAIIPDMRAAGVGRIINISSSSAQAGSGFHAHYAASKGGVIGFTKGLAIEFAGTGITANNVAPGFVDTEGLRAAPLEVDKVASVSPMKRAGRPENIAAAVAFLASDDADYVTGHTLSVNGGRYLN